MTPLFRQKVATYGARLMKDLGITDFQAAGVFGNIGHECNGFKSLQEEKPTVKGSRGGWGWMQWTGPRRKAFEAYAASRGLDLAADDTNYIWLVGETLTDEAKSLRALKMTKTVESATASFMKNNLRPGIEHLEGRQKWAKAALDVLKGVHAPAPPERPTVPVVPISDPVAAVPVTSGIGWFSKLFAWRKPTPVVPTTPGDPVVYKVQTRLYELGYTEVGKLDGIPGQKLGRAIQAFREDNDLPDGKEIDDKVLAALPKAQHREIDPSRGNATAQDLRAAGSSPVAHFDMMGLVGKLMLGAAGLGGVDQTGALDSVKEAAEGALSTFQTVQALVVNLVGAIQWCLHHWWIFALAGGVYVLYHAVMGILKLVDLFRRAVLQQAK